MRTYGYFPVLATAFLTATAAQPANLAAIDDTIAKIAQHAKNYPPQFSSAAERKSSEEDLRKAIGLLDALVAEHPNDPEFLLRDGFANAMGHNLDFKGCAQK